MKKKNDEIIHEMRKIRKAINAEYEKNPQKVIKRWSDIETKYKHNLVQRNPKLIRKNVA